jgi:hypothetical protein
MSANLYIKQYQQNIKPQVDRLFDDLEQYHNFCREFGHNYNPAHLYKENVMAYKEFTKFRKGRDPRNRWIEDAKKFNKSDE